MAYKKLDRSKIWSMKKYVIFSRCYPSWLCVCGYIVITSVFPTYEDIIEYYISESKFVHINDKDDCENDVMDDDIDDW